MLRLIHLTDVILSVCCKVAAVISMSLLADFPWASLGKLPPALSLAYPIYIVAPHPILYAGADVRLDVNQISKLRSTMQLGGEALVDVHWA